MYILIIWSVYSLNMSMLVFCIVTPCGLNMCELNIKYFTLRSISYYVTYIKQISDCYSALKFVPPDFR
jgi:hypothetical protein